jgi:hypothetical protein
MDLVLRDRALASLWVFCEEIIGLKMEERPHREIIEYLEEDLQPNKMLLVPRDTGKTTLVSTAYPLWMVLRAYFQNNNPCYRVLVDSATVRNSKYVIKNIVSWVQNSEKFKEAFGNLYSKKGDTADGFSMSFRVNSATAIKEPNFVASGVGAEKTGLHFDLICMDDIVTKDNVRSVAQREKVWEHYRMMQAILESDASGQNTRQLVVGTVYSADDLYGRIILQDKERIAEGKPPTYAPMIRAAVSEDGELYYPSKLTLEVLAHRRAVMGSALFSAQYLLDPNRENAPLKTDQLKWHSIASFPADLRWIRLSADPAYKEEQRTHGDYAALVVAGWDRWNALWILDVVMRKDLTPEKFIEQVFFLAKKWQIESAIIEEAHQGTMDIFFMREMQKRQTDREAKAFPVSWVKPSRIAGKETRWLAIQAYAERKAIKIADEIDSAIKVEIQDEWERAPFSRYDDFLDALQLQTLYLPINVMSVDDGMAPEGGRSVEEILEAGRTGGTTPYFGTLADRFPFLGKTHEEAPFGAEEPLGALMDGTFGD